MRSSIQNIDLVRFVETAYRVDLDDQAWLTAIGERFEELVGHGEGANLYFYRAQNNTLEAVGSPVHTASRNRNSKLVKHFQNTIAKGMLGVFLRRLHPQMVERTYLSPLEPGMMLAATAKQAAAMGRPELAVRPPAFARLFGISDAWGMIIPDERGGGLAMACPEFSPQEHPACHAEAMKTLMPILAAAQRLRHHRASLQRGSAMEAVLSPDGTIQHATGAARAHAEQEHLQHAAAEFDTSRASRERGAWTGEPVWPGIIDGRWSLVERIERDGRRFIVAHANGPGAINPRGLNTQERKVAERVAAGDMNKEVAAALECSKATAEAVLARVLKKWGLRSRLELVLDYQRDPMALARRVGGLSPEEPNVEIETDLTLHFDADLTPAQNEVASLVAQGHSNAEIAKRRKTSVRTFEPLPIRSNTSSSAAKCTLVPNFWCLPFPNPPSNWTIYAWLPTRAS